MNFCVCVGGGWGAVVESAFYVLSREDETLIDTPACAPSDAGSIICASRNMISNSDWKPGLVRFSTTSVISPQILYFLGECER